MTYVIGKEKCNFLYRMYLWNLTKATTESVCSRRQRCCDCFKQRSSVFITCQPLWCCPYKIYACRAFLLRQRMLGCTNSIMFFQLTLLSCFVNRVALMDRFGQDNPFLAHMFIQMSTIAVLMLWSEQCSLVLSQISFAHRSRFVQHLLIKLPFQIC